MIWLGIAALYLWLLIFAFVELSRSSRTKWESMWRKSFRRGWVRGCILASVSTTFFALIARYSSLPVPNTWMVTWGGKEIATAIVVATIAGMVLGSLGSLAATVRDLAHACRTAKQPN